MKNITRQNNLNKYYMYKGYFITKDRHNGLYSTYTSRGRLIADTQKSMKKLINEEVINMKKNNLGVIIGKRDHHEGTIYYTKTCDYLIYEEDNLVIVEGLLKGLKKEINFIPEDEKGFVVGSFRNEEEALKAITEFEKSQWNKK